MLPPPFIVPAVQEYVMGSQYRAITRTVPGEADLHCAMAAQQNKRTMVLTNDSDLLLYDLGEKDSVCFLRKMCLSEVSHEAAHTHCERLTADVGHPKTICNRMGIPNLRQLAYVLSQNARIALPQAVRQVKETPVLSDSALAYRQQYDTAASCQKQLFEWTGLLQFEKYGQHLNPRVAELILQMAHKSPDTDLYVYLPLLFEDPSRSSAWAPSSHIRSLAYDCLGPFENTSDAERPTRTVKEYRRKGSRHVFEDANVNHDRTLDLTSNLNLLTRRLQQVMEICTADESHGDHIPFWRVFAICEVCRLNPNPQDMLPDTLPDDAVMVLLGDHTHHWNWKTIHLQAQVDGFLYSLHKLRQILQYISSTSEINNFLPLDWRLLFDCLSRMPSLPGGLMPSRKELEAAICPASLVDLESITRDVWRSMKEAGQES